jgi:hypothetical protein
LKNVEAGALLYYKYKSDDKTYTYVASNQKDEKIGIYKEPVLFVNWGGLTEGKIIYATYYGLQNTDVVKWEA